MQKQESKFGLQVRAWIMANPYATSSIETKDTRGKPSFPFNEFKSAQENFGEAISYGKKGVLIRTEGVEGLPDYIYLRNEPSNVWIKYPQGFVIISNSMLAMEKKTSKRASLTWKRAKDIALKVVEK